MIRRFDSLWIFVYKKCKSLYLISEHSSISEQIVYQSVQSN